MTRTEAEVRAKAYLREHPVEDGPKRDDFVHTVDDGVLVTITHCSQEDLARFICPLIERELPFQVRRVGAGCLRIYSTQDFKQEYDLVLLESDKGGFVGWTKRRFLALKGLFPPIPGEPFMDYYPGRKKWTRGATTDGRRKQARKSLQKWQSKKLVPVE